MLESKLYSLLSNATAISASVGTRIYPIVAPENPTYPYVTYSRVTGIKDNSLSGYCGMENVHVQVDVWGTVYGGVKSLSKTIHQTMETSTDFKAILLSDQDLTEVLENEDIIYREVLDFSCWNGE